MPRRKAVEPRKTDPDPKYGEVVVAKLSYKVNVCEIYVTVVNSIFVVISMQVFMVVDFIYGTYFKYFRKLRK